MPCLPLAWLVASFGEQLEREGEAEQELSEMGGNERGEGSIMALSLLAFLLTLTPLLVLTQTTLTTNPALKR